MSSIHPQIERLQDAPIFNEWYATFLLSQMISEIDEQDEVEIGVYSDGNEEGSYIGFDGDDFDNIQLYLRCHDYQFYLILHENSEINFASVFKYTIFEDSDLLAKIPVGLRELMQEAAVEQDCKTFKK